METIEIDHQENYKYCRALRILYIRFMEHLKRNDRCVYRIHYINSMTKRRSRDVALLKERLDRYNDGWRNVPDQIPHRTRKTELKRGPKPKQKNADGKTIRQGPKKAKNVDKTPKQKPMNSDPA